MNALIFDLDDTLYDLADPLYRALKKVYGNRIEEPGEAQFIAFRKYSDERFEESRNGAISMEEMFIYRIRKTLEEIGVQTTDEEALFFQDTYVECQRTITLTDTMKEMLSWCKKQNILTAVLSNGAVDHQMDKINALGILSYIPRHRLFFSDAMEYAKPDKRIFEQAAKTLGLENTSESPIYYIGDSFENDVSGPKKAGWKTVWYNHRNYALPESPIPDYMVRTEAELFETVKTLAEINFQNNKELMD